MAFTPTCSAVILTGGLNRRMHGRNKAFIPLGGRRFLSRIIDTVTACLEDCLIVTRETALYREQPAKIVADIFGIRSPLTGIHAGLVNMSSEFAFVTSCDTPLLKKAVVKLLIDALEPEVDVVVPASGTFFQPLCAIYSRSCANVIEDLLRRGEMKVDRLFESVRVKRIAYRYFEAVDPELHSFFNVNTPADLETAHALWERIAGEVTNHNSPVGTRG